MAKFIGYTVGLEANNGHSQVGKMVKVEYSRNSDNTVTLRPVSGRNLAAMGLKKTISSEDFDNRPCDPYSNAEEAMWALRQVGWSPMADDCAEQ